MRKGMNLDDSSLIVQLRRKNPKAMDFLVDNYSNLVFSVVRNVLNPGFNYQYVEECVYEVFWSVWNNMDSFDESKGEFKNWIAAVAKYKAIDYRRKFFRQINVESIDEYNLAGSVSTEDLVIAKENREELIKAIKSMKDDDREIFVRRYFLGEDIESIARTLGVNRNLVDKRLSRGRRVLKEKIVS